MTTKTNAAAPKSASTKKKNDLIAESREGVGTHEVAKKKVDSPELIAFKKRGLSIEDRYYQTWTTDGCKCTTGNI